MPFFGSATDSKTPTKAAAASSKTAAASKSAKAPKYRSVAAVADAATAQQSFVSKLLGGSTPKGPAWAKREAEMALTGGRVRFSKHDLGLFGEMKPHPKRQSAAALQGPILSALQSPRRHVRRSRVGAQQREVLMRSARPVGLDATQPGGDPISDSGAECGAGKEASGGDTLIRREPLKRTVSSF